VKFQPRVVGGTERESLMADDLVKLTGCSPDGASVLLCDLARVSSNLQRIMILVGQHKADVMKAREFLRKYDWLS